MPEISLDFSNQFEGDDSFLETEEIESLKYLTFLICSEKYGTGVENIKEIIEYTSITRIPTAPDYIRGVLNLRGNVVPVIDLARRIGKPASPVTKRSCIIIVEMQDEDGSLDIGFVVDQVEEVMDITEDRLTSAPQFGTDIRNEFIYAMCKTDEQFIVLLALDVILSVKELSIMLE